MDFPKAAEELEEPSASDAVIGHEVREADAIDLISPTIERIASLE